MPVFGEYSRYYDLLYRDKDYRGEALYVDSIIKKHVPNARTMLELGCGTGRYTAEFSRMGYRVHGVDLSEEMILEARRVQNDNISLSCGDARTVRLSVKFDVVAALFHVMSYQTSNDDVLNTLVTMKEHLGPGGIAIFDFWYGPSVLMRRPETRFKEVGDEVIKVSRVATPEMFVERNVVAVNYTAFIRNKADGLVSELRETHNMRYFFDPEISFLSGAAGLAVVCTEAWMGGEANADTWSVTKVLREVRDKP